MPRDILTEDMRETSQWWDGVDAAPPAATALPTKVDVAIVGSGYTGLCAALELLRAGRSVALFEAERLGFGCSTRNGGQVSAHMKPGLHDLARRHGEQKALAILRTGYEAYEFLSDLLATERIDCDFRKTGHFLGAHTPGSYDAIARSEPAEAGRFGYQAYAVPRAEQRAEVGTDAFHGGIVYPDAAQIDPARYHRGLLDRVIAAGAGVHAKARVDAVAPQGAGFTLRIGAHAVSARNVLVATNGYTGPATPWMRRRIIPIGSFIIATEPQPEAMIRRLSPKDRTISETRKVVYYYRASPDHRRMVFGGRVSIGHASARYSAPRLHAAMSRVFPELATARVSHSWYGFVGFTFDNLPHLGCHDGVHYAMGYCGVGIAMASYLGTKIAQQILARPEGATALDDVAFQTRPAYWGRPWFLAPSILYYKARDALAR